MNTRYEITYEVPVEMLQRAMASWAQPHRSVRYRLVWGAIMMLCGVALGAVMAFSGLFRILPDGFWTGCLVGFYIGLGYWLFTHRRTTGRLSRMSAAHLAKQGVTTGVFTVQGIELSTRLGASHSTWAAYDEVILMQDTTVLRAGAVLYPVPHAALPRGTDPATFHADLCRWQEAAA